VPEHSTQDLSIQALIDQALQATQQMDHRRAHSLLEEAIGARAPDLELEMASLMLAETHLILGRWEQAKQKLESLLESPSTVEVQIRAELALGELFWVRGTPEKAREFLIKAGQLAESNSLPSWTLLCLVRQAALAGETGELDRCLDLLEQAEILIKAWRGDPAWAELSAALDTQWGLYHFRQSQRESAEERLNKALQTLRQGHCQSLEEPRILRYLGVMASQRLEHQHSMQLHLEALALYTRAGYALGQAKAYDSIGRSLLQANRLTEATLTFKKSERLCLQLGAHSQLATLYGKLGQVATLGHDLDGAIQYFQKDLMLSHRYRNDYALAFSYRNLGRCLMQVGQFEEALSNLNESISLFQNVEDWRNLARVYMDLGFAYARANHTQDAVDMRQRAAGLFQEHDLVRELTFLSCLDGILARSENKLQEAETHFKTCIEALIGGASGLWLGESYYELGLLYRQFDLPSQAYEAFKSAFRSAKDAGLPRHANRYLQELDSLDEVELIRVWMEELPEAAEDRLPATA